MAPEVPFHEGLPVRFGLGLRFSGTMQKVLGARRDMPDFVVKNSFEKARALGVARRADPFQRRRCDVQPACFQHHRHHGEPRSDVVTGGMGCFPQPRVGRRAP